MFITKINNFYSTSFGKKDSSKSDKLKYVLPLSAALAMAQPIPSNGLKAGGVEDTFSRNKIELTQKENQIDAQKEEQLGLLLDSMGIESSPYVVQHIMAEKTITIDAGHGGNFPVSKNPVNGTKFKNPIDKKTYYEKDVNLAIAKKVQKYLKELGANVVMTRDSDDYVERLDRALIAQKHNSDIFISIHADANIPRLKGSTVYKYKPEKREGESKLRVVKNPKDNELLAKEIDTALSTLNDYPTQGVKDNDFEVLREANVERKIKLYNEQEDENEEQKEVLSTPPASALIETGFMSNKEEGLKLIDPQYQDKIAKAIAQSLVNYTFKKVPSELIAKLKEKESLQNRTYVFNNY